MEEWKTIPEYPPYEVSSYGRVRRITYLAAHPSTGDGYATVGFWDGGRCVGKAKVHRLVARAFVPNPESKLQVNHIDGNKMNPRADNLEWVTASENIQHMLKRGRKERRGETHPLSKFQPPQIVCIRAFAGIWRQRSMARKFCVTQHAICQIIERKTWRHLQPAPSESTNQKALMKPPPSRRGRLKIVRD